MDLALFPLHSVLCPGVAMPLHIFEERYRLMIGRCIERGDPFGVVLIRDGREVGTIHSKVADVGTTALIRQAGRYLDGRMDIVTVGGRRFRIEELDATNEPYLVGQVTMLDEPLGERGAVSRLRSRVGQRFLRYLELLQPALASDDGPEIEIEVEIDAADDVAEEDEEPEALELSLGNLGDSAAPERSIDTSGLDDEQRRELLMAAARRLTQTGDPTALSYLITGLIQVELRSRQDLLEAPDTASRLALLDTLLMREIQLLSKHLKPLTLDPRLVTLRRN